MANELYTNNAGTTLNGAINNVTTSVVVTDASTFPTSGNFRILIDQEIMKVTAVSTNTLTVVRGQEGTTATTHANGANVDEVVTSAAIDAIRGDNVIKDLFANRPSPRLAGLLFYPTDGFYKSLDTGTAWKSWGPIFPIKEPPTSGWAFYDNTGTNSFTASTTNGGIYLSSLATSTASNNRVLYYRTYPTGSFTLDIGFIPNIPADIADTNNCDFGLGFADSSNKVETFSLTTLPGNNLFDIRVCSWSSHIQGGTRTNVQSQPLYLQGQYFFFRYTDDATNRYFYISYDAINYSLFYTEATNTFVTPTIIGIFCGAGSEADGDGYGIHCFHWTGVS